MRKTVKIILIACIVFSIMGGVVYYFRSSNKVDTLLLTKGTKPTLKKIVEEKRISGYVEPVKEVALKPQVSGVIEKLFVRAGDYVKKGQKIASIKVIVNPSSLEDLNNSRLIAEKNYNLAQIEMERNKSLLDAGAIAISEFQRFENSARLREQELRSLVRKIQLTKKGYIDGEKQVSNHVLSTIEGIVLSVPNKEGSIVRESNNFNEGSTVATVADMKQMLFKGRVPEVDIRYLQLGMQFPVKVSVVEGDFLTTLTYISPKGVQANGIPRFEIEGVIDVTQTDSLTIRSGYSAVAHITLNETEDKVLSIEEAFLHHKGDSVFVFINEKGKRTKQAVSLGLSNGVDIEIKEGLTQESLLLK